MKKLLIALTAAAAGVFASTAMAGEPSVTTYDAIGFDLLESGSTLDTTGWVVDQEKPPTKLAVTAVGERTLPSGVEYPVTGEGAEVNYLDIKTDLTAPIYRDGFAGKTLANTVFFDSLVKFTATDTQPVAADYSGAKIIVYALDLAEAEMGEGVKLYALSKDAKGDAVHYDLGEIDIDAWHRLTIKAVKAANNGAEIAFVVYVDQMAKKYSNTGVTAFDAATLTLEGKGLNGAKKLIPSLVEATSVTGAGFAGQGQIDDLVFTDSVGTWADEATFTLANEDENITAFTYTALDQNDETLFTGDQDSASMAYVENMKVRIDSVTFAAGKWELAVTGEGITYDAQTKTITGITANSAATLAANDVTPRVEVTIEEKTTSYPSLGAALAAIGEGTAALKLKEDLTLKAVDDGQGGSVSEGVIMGNVTLDLAGKTIIGADGYAGYVIENAGTLLIKDTVGNGSVAAAKGNAGAVYTIGEVTIEGGTFIGEVGFEAPGTIAAITGGKFSVKPDYTPVEGKTWKQDESNYYYIADADRAQIGDVTYATLGDAIKAAVDGDEIKLLLNSEEGGKNFAIAASAYPTKGLTIDLNEKTLTFNADAVENADNVKDCITINTNNIVTIKNGTIAVAATGANGKATKFRDVIRYYAHADYNTLTLNGVTFDCANLPLTDGESHPVAPLQIEGGNITFTEVAFTNVVEGGYTLKFGNHANETQYKMGTYTFDDATAAGLTGNVLLAGGTLVGAEKFAESEALFFYGKNSWSSWDDAVSAPFAARFGKSLADATGAEDLQLGQLYFDVDEAVEAYADAEEGDELVVFGTLTATEDVSISIELAPVKAEAIEGAEYIYLVPDGPALVTKTADLEETLPPEDEKTNVIKASEPDADGWITYTCVAKSVGPAVIGVGAGGVEPVQGEPGVYVVSGDPSSHNVAIDPASLQKTDVIRVTDSTIGKITGVPADQIEIKLNGVTTAIDQKYFVGGDAENGFSLELSDAAKAELIEASDEQKPLVIGDDVAVTIKTVAGLKYQLVRGTEVGSITEALGDPVLGNGQALTLEDANKPEGKAFYVIKTSK